ncbi:MAG: 50S ribosomal protein L32e [Candidatus Bathyarchaeota archaeon]|jgi:large subunit ribosomal protein L32e|nr:50S ribosomal protein L32e [Candidatus Bathyarchaeota archaeon]UCC28159.1 MAG: 50S ribosomal protein L32e [Candidatus Bathyarchaeota archaeon]
MKSDKGEAEKSATKRALALRRLLKGKKPKFRRQESWRYKRVSEVWRKPTGIDSKMRRKKKGWPKSAEVGYRGPRAARRLHPSGYAEVLIRTVDDVDQVEPETQAIRIAHTVGARKRIEIMARARESHVHILNPREIEKPLAEEEAEAEETTNETEEAEEEKK